MSSTLFSMVFTAEANHSKAAVASTLTLQRVLRDLMSGRLSFPPQSLFQHWCAEFHLSHHSRNVASTWAKVISSMGLHNDAVVVEIAPGHSPKVGLGLFAALPRFAGRLIVIEPDAKALETIVHIYRRVFPAAEVVGICDVLASSRTKELLLAASSVVDAVLANHPLDDMIIGQDFVAAIASGNAELVDNYFSDMYSEKIDEAEKVAKEAVVWRQLEQGRPDDCALYQCQVVNDWLDFTCTIRPRHLVISQYESRTLQKYGLAIPDRLAFEVLKKLAEKLPPISQTARRVLTDKGFDPRRWIVV